MKLLDRPTLDIAVMNTAATSISGPNQKTYARLKTSLRLNLRRQIFLAVCDDLELRSRIVAKLQKDLAPHFISLNLNLTDPNPMAQVSEWLVQRGGAFAQGGVTPTLGFQILGIEHLTRQPAPVQKRFLTHLQALEYYMPALECTLLLWLPRPWLRSVRQSAPTFWDWHTALFEFEGDPTPAKVLTRQPIARIPIAKIDAWTGPDLGYPIAQPTSPTNGQQQPASVEPPRLDAAELEDADLLPEAPQLPETIWDILTEDLSRLDSDPATQARAIAPDSLLPDALAPAADLAPDADALVVEPEQAPVTADVPPAIAADLDLASATVKRVMPTAPYAALLNAYQNLEQQPAAIAKDTVQTVNPNRVVGAKLHHWLNQAFAAEPESEQHQIALNSLQRLEQLEQQQVPHHALATAYYALGRSYRECIEQGDTSVHSLEIAICAHEQTLDWLEDESPLWSDAANDLGNLYWMRSRNAVEADVQLASLNQAIQAYQLALEKLDPAKMPKTIAMIQNNLGSAYGDLAQYQDPAKNLQQSVQAYETALRYRSATDEPARYAATQNNLGTACWNLAQHQQPLTYLKQAIAAYQQALGYYTTENEPLSFAMIQNNMGTAYWNLAQHLQPKPQAQATSAPSPEKLLRLAIAAYEKALQFRTLEAAPAAFAATQNNLGTAHWDLAALPSITPAERSARLQQAVTAYEAAIAAVAVLTSQLAHRPALTFDIFSTHNNLGLAYYHLATDPHSQQPTSERQTALEAALHNHLQALQGWEPRSEFHQATLEYVVQTVRTFFGQFGIQGQNIALSKIPATLLPEIMRKL